MVVGEARVQWNESEDGVSGRENAQANTQIGTLSPKLKLGEGQQQCSVW
jgi:hypothetical protein